MSTAPPLVRNAYTPGGMLHAEDFARDQSYFLAIQALRCRSLHTPGIAAGLEVTPVAGQAASVRVAAGMAIDPAGRQLILDRAQLLDLSDRVEPTLYLTIAADSRYVDWTIAPQGAGYAAIDDTARLVLSATPPMPDAAGVLLARLRFTPERRLLPPDRSVRTPCGLAVGHVDLPSPVAVGDAPRLGVSDAGDALLLAAPVGDLFGSLRVEGCVTVGSAPAGTAGLAVRTPPAVPGAGTISSDGPYLLGSDAYDLAALTPGDQVLVPAPGEAIAADTAIAFTVVAVAGQTITVDRAPVPALSASPYAVVRRDLLRIRPRPGATALAVSCGGTTGIGGAADDDATLSIHGGDLLLATGSTVRFTDDGAITAGGGARAVELTPGGQSLTIRDTGAIAFDVAGAPGPGLYLDGQGRVGVGTDHPTARLSVDGVIRASGGILFADGTHQTEGVAAIPIGTIVAWWRAPGDTGFLGSGFQLCDGSTITDAASPLAGLKTPDLNGTFVRGAISYEQIGRTGGAATHTHGFVLPQHTHGIAHVHPVTGYTTNVIGTAGDNIAGSSVSTDDHVHTIETLSGTASPATSGSNAATPGAQTQPADNLPPYVTLLRAMRIR